jgi:hypothetical protein
MKKMDRRRILVAVQFRPPQTGRRKTGKTESDIFKDPKPRALYIFPHLLSRSIVFFQCFMSLLTYIIYQTQLLTISRLHDQKAISGSHYQALGFAGGYDCKMSR